MKLSVQEALPDVDGAMSVEDLYRLAEKNVAEDKLDDAEDIFNWLLERDRNNAYLLFGIASAQLKREHKITSLHLLERALEIDPDMGEAWNNLGYIYHSENEIPRAEECFTHAVRLNSEVSAYHNNLATLFVNAGCPEKALPHCERAIELDPDVVDPHWNKALALLEMRNWVEGFKLYDWGLHDDGKRKKRSYNDANRTVERWRGEKDKHVVVYGEQGVGDEIMFASVLPDLIKDSKSVIYEAHPRLMNIMRRSFPDVTVYGTRKENEIYWPGFHELDMHTAIGSLPEYYRKKDEDFPREPYLVQDDALVAEFKDKLAQLGPKPKIGISWKGGTKTTRNDLRSLKLSNWLPIFESIDADWISLQYQPNSQLILDTFKEEHGVTLHHWADDIANLDRNYAGLMPALDLVISVCTSAVHAAGAFGVPCWCLTPKATAWRYGIEGEMPWYSSVRLFRQEDKDWAPVVNEIAKELAAKFAKEDAA